MNEENKTSEAEEIKKLTNLSDEIKRLKKSDIIIIVILSIILGILTFYSATAQFSNIERGNSYARIVNIVIMIPVEISTIPMYFITFFNFGDPEGAALGAGILIEFLSPVFAFVFWFFIFWLFARLNKKLWARRGNFIWKHIPSIVIVILIISPYLYYKTGSNEVNACLSGALNSQMMSGSGTDTNGNVVFKPELFTVGPDMCFNSILDSVIYKKNSSSKEAINFCLGLSDNKKVGGTQISYRDYCIYELGFELVPYHSMSPNGSLTTDFHRQYMPQLPLPLYTELDDKEKNNEWWAIYQAKLCEIYSLLSNSQDKKSQCLIYYINYPTYPDNVMTQIYCKVLTSSVLPQRCVDNTQSPSSQPTTKTQNTSTPNITSVAQPTISLLINGSHNPTAIKLNSEFTVSWSTTGQIDRCQAFGAFVSRADGKGFWGKGDYSILPPDGNMTLIANSSLINLQVECAVNIGKPSYISVSDNVNIKTEN